MEFEYAHQGVAVVVIDRYRILCVEDDRNTDFGFLSFITFFSRYDRSSPCAAAASGKNEIQRIEISVRIYLLGEIDRKQK